MKICENCQCEHAGSYGSGRFCSEKCARSFVTKTKRKEINEKVSKKLRGRPTNRNGWEKYNKKHHGEACSNKVIILCLNCETSIEMGANSTKKFCSKSCSSSYIQKQLVKESRHNGFPSRKDKNPSWAEQFVIDFLNNKGINFERDYKINRFFADFAFVNDRVILEIDGKQHKERKEYDKNRDSIIQKEGWKIVRIPWKHRDFDDMMKKLESFIKLNLQSGIISIG